MSNTAQPSVAATAIATGLLGLLAGYFLGQGSSIGLFDKTGNPDEAKKSWPNNYAVKIHVDSSEEESEAEEDDERDEGFEDEEDADGKELKTFEDVKGEVKLVLAVRTDLGMGKGKIAAQCSHATLACYKYLRNNPSSASLLRRWEWGGQAKIAVQVKTEDEMMTLQAQAMSLGLCARIIHDAGRTQIAAGSATVLGVLGPKSVVDQVTGQLKLL